MVSWLKVTGVPSDPSALKDNFYSDSAKLPFGQRKVGEGILSSTS